MGRRSPGALLDHRGTSKALENDLPSDLKREVILRIFGSPDQRQIDGLAGANS